MDLRVPRETRDGRSGRTNGRKLLLHFLHSQHLTSRDGGNAIGLPGAILALAVAAKHRDVRDQNELRDVSASEQVLNETSSEDSTVSSGST